MERRRYELKKAQTSNTTDGEDVCSRPSPKKTRQMQTLSFDNSKCVYCQKVCRRSGELIHFSTFKACDALAENLKTCTNSIWKSRLQDVDLIAAEVKYHSKCHTSFRNSCRTTTSTTTNSKDPNDDDNNDATDGCEKLYESIRPFLELGKAYYIDELVAMYKELTGHSRRKDSLKRSFIMKYGSQVVFSSSAHKQGEIMFSTSISLHDVINAAFEKANADLSSSFNMPSVQTHHTSDDMLLQEAATILQNSKVILEPTRKHTWRKFRCSASPCTATPANVFRILSGKKQQESEDHNNHFKIMSIAQDIIALSLRRIPPKHMSLSSAMKHLTGSKAVINQLNRLGHCCSYTELLRLETAMAEVELAKSKEIGVIIPPNIQSGAGFIQAAADNDDFCEDTIDGKRTTHATTMVLYQHNQSEISLDGHPAKTRNRAITDYEELVEISNIQKNKDRSSPLLYQH